MKSETLSRTDRQMNLIQDIWQEADVTGLLRLEIEGISTNENYISVGKNQMINFGSCSYLCLETNEEIKASCKEAVDKFGVQFSSTRAALSLPLYSKLELLLTKIFSFRPIVFPSTTLAHFSAISVVINEKDGVLYDQFLHQSAQMSLDLAKAKGVQTRRIPHNNLSALESKLIEYENQYDRVWYFCDGIYSIHGDRAPLKELQELQERYPNLYLYVDDAHGMSWCGRHGKGYALSKLKMNNRIIVATSLSKGFGCAGGALITNNMTFHERISKFGPTLIFGGPIQPPLLGAMIASANIHLSEDLHEKQAKLKKNITYRNNLIKELKIPCEGPFDTPLLFVKIGDHKKTASVSKSLMENGFYVNPAIFPVVPNRGSGLRLTLNSNHSKKDIYDCLALISQLVSGDKCE